MTKDEALQKLNFYLELRNYSKSAIIMYPFYIEKFLNSFPEGFDFSQLSPKDALQYIVTLKSTGNFSVSSLNLIISELRTFYEFVLDITISKRLLPNIRQPRLEPLTFSHSQIKLLLKDADLRLKALILLGIDCGFRARETVYLKVCDIDSKNMLLHIKDSKRGKSRYVKLSELCLQALREYWKLHRDDTFIFPGRTDGHLSVGTVHNLFNAFLKECHMDSNLYSFHSLRHTYATWMVSNDCDIFTLKKALGHSSFASTARYIHKNTEDISNFFSVSDRVDIL